VHPHPTGSRAPERVAVIGSGVAGLTAAHVLSRTHQVTVFEAEDRFGGHAHTHTVPDSRGGELRVDSGFIVHNDRTYPHLLRLFAELGVETRPTEMSMSIRDETSGLEYAGGRGVRGFVARPRQLLDRDYLALLRSVRRFHALARELLDTTTDDDETTFGEFISAGDFPEPFVRWYAVPLVACVWSSGTGDALDYPARYLFRFLDHHGMLSVGGSPQWRTVVGGSQAYVDALVAGLRERRGEARSRAPVSSVLRDDDGVTVTSTHGVERFDRVVIATHADQALALLGDPSPEEKDVLGAFRYSRNETVLHRDTSLLPRTRAVRSSWNYLVPADDTAGAPVVTYWMNRLQGLPDHTPLLVTLNATDRIAPESVIATMGYTHPLYEPRSVAAQRRLPSLSHGRTAFAGAHHGWGFHEDGCRSGVEAARASGGTW